MAVSFVMLMTALAACSTRVKTHPDFDTRIKELQRLQQEPGGDETPGGDQEPRSRDENKEGGKGDEVTAVAVNQIQSGP